jgi:hypothetical protein
MDRFKLHGLISGLLLLWGMAYAGLVYFTFVISTPAHWAALVAKGQIKAEYADYIAALPGWVVPTTVLAALSRLFGALFLLLRLAWAFHLYVLSLGFVTAIMFRGFVLAGVASVIRSSQIALEIVFLLISVFAVWYSKLQIRNGVLK